MASRVEEKREVCPNRRISPRSAGKWPETMWEKLDLPAPLAPTRAWISPWQRPREKETTLAYVRTLSRRRVRQGPVGGVFGHVHSSHGAPSFTNATA
jgi:hypothetical protein